MAYQRPISRYRITNDLNIDIRYCRIHPNVVPEYEAMEAAVFGNYNWIEFNKLDLETRALCVAQYRMHNRIDSVINQEITAYSKAKARSAARG